MSEVQHLPHRPSGAGGPSVPLLRARGSDPPDLPRLRACGAADAGDRHPAAGAAPGRALSERPGRTHGPRHHQHQVVSSANPRRRRARRGRSPDRHADDREGARLSQRDAGRCGRCGHGTLPAGLSLGREDVPAHRAGGGPRGSWAEGGPRAGPDASPVPSRAGVGLPARRRRISARGEKSPPRATVPTRAVAGEHHRVRGGGRRDVEPRCGGGGLVPGADRQARAPRWRCWAQRRARWRRSRIAGGGTCCSRGSPRTWVGSCGTRRAGCRESEEAGRRAWCSTATPHRCCSGRSRMEAPGKGQAVAQVIPSEHVIPSEARDVLDLGSIPAEKIPRFARDDSNSGGGSALPPPTSPDTRSPCPRRAPVAAPAPARGRTLR